MEENTTPLPPASPTPPPPAATGDVSKDAKMFGMLCHLSALAGFVIPFGNIIGPLVFWLIKKNEFAFVDDQGKEALNFQITTSLAMIVCLILTLVLIGALLLVAVGVTALIFTIIAAIKANDGVAYRYPFALRLIK
jgi:uncharacterized Tic20 family protein